MVGRVVGMVVVDGTGAGVVGFAEDQNNEYRVHIQCFTYISRFDIKFSNYGLFLKFVVLVLIA